MLAPSFPGIIFLTFVFITFAQIQGPVTFNTGGEMVDVSISPDGNIIILSLRFNNLVQVYANNGSTFILDSSIAMTQDPKNLFIIPSKQKMIIGTNNSKIMFYDKMIDDTYALVQTVSPFYKRNNPQMTDDGKYSVILKSSKSISILQRIGGTLSEIQQINTTAVISDIQFSQTFKFLVFLDANMDIYIYENNGSFLLKQTIGLGTFFARRIKVTDEAIIATVFSPDILIYKNNGTDFVLDTIFTTPESNVLYFHFLSDLSKVVFTGSTTMYVFTLVNGTYQQKFSITEASTIKGVTMDQLGLYYTLITMAFDVNTYFECPSECVACTFPNSCSSCLPGYNLENGKCILPAPTNNSTNNLTHCVKNQFKIKNVCKEYCSKKCLTCNQTRNDCGKCAEFYTKNQQGECILKNEEFQIILMVRPFLNVIRRKGIRFLFMAIDDLWLYNYHNKKYKGIIRDVFITIKFIEEKQWEIIQLEEWKEELQNSISIVKQYNPQSNPTYLLKERKTNLFIDSTYTYFVFFVPCSIVLLAIFNRVFYLLFNFQISKFLRPYCFWWVMFDILIMSNAEFFTFLGFRSFITSFAFNFNCKMLITLGIGVFFLVFLGSFSCYAIYYTQYGKLARYFLINMFRFPSSYLLMIICYGIRPFLKGVVHALLYDDWVLQIQFLIIIEGLTLIAIMAFEMFLDNYKSGALFMMEVSYFASLIILNILLLCRYEFFEDMKEMDALFEQITAVIIYFMLIILLMKLIWQLIPWDKCKYKKNEQNDSQSTEAQNNLEEEKGEKAQQQKIQNNIINIEYKVDQENKEIIIIAQLKENESIDNEFSNIKIKSSKMVENVLKISDPRTTTEKDLEVINISQKK